jgi:hypothetical protein
MDYLSEAQALVENVTAENFGRDINTALAYAFISIAEDVRRIADAQAAP